MVVQNYVGVLHQTKRTHCQQVGVPRSRSYQINHASGRFAGAAHIVGGGKQAFGQMGFVHRRGCISQHLLEKIFLKPAARGVGGDGLLDICTLLFSNHYGSTQSGRQKLFEALAEQARDHRS